MLYEHLGCFFPVLTEIFKLSLEPNKQFVFLNTPYIMSFNCKQGKKNQKISIKKGQSIRSPFLM